MRRRQILIPQSTQNSLDLQQSLEDVLSLLLQISQLNKELLEYVALAHRSDSENKEILGQLKNIKKSIDNIEETYKEKTQRMKELRFSYSDANLLRRLVDRVTQRMYRKEFLHQKYSRYLPNSILLHKQVLTLMKILMKKAESGEGKDIIQLVQLLNTLQYQNILLYKHLVNLFVETNVIGSQEEILRQVQVETGRERRESERDSRLRMQEDFDFNEYIDHSIMGLEMEKEANCCVVHRQRGRFELIQEEEPVIKRVSKAKMSQEIQVEIDRMNEEEEQIKEIVIKVEEVKQESFINNNTQQSERGQEVIQKDLQLLSVHNTQTSQQQPSTTSVKKYILNKPNRIEVKLKKPENLTPISKVKLTINQNRNFLLEKEKVDFEQNHSQNQPQNMRTHFSQKKIRKNQFGLKSRHQLHLSLGHSKTPTILPRSLMSMANSKNNSVYSSQKHRTEAVSIKSLTKMKSARDKEDRKRECTPRKNQSEIENVVPATNDYSGFENLGDQENLYHSKFSREKLRQMLPNKRIYSKKGDLSDILFCNSYTIYEQKYNKKVGADRSSICKCKDGNRSFNQDCRTHNPPKLFLKNAVSRSSKQQFKEVGYKSLADFSDVFGLPRRSTIMRIPTYYSSGRKIREKMQEKEKEMEQRQISQQYFNKRSNIDNNPNNQNLIKQRSSILVDTVNLEMNKNAFSGKKIKAKSLKKSGAFKKNKQPMFEIYSTIQKEVL